MCKKNNGGGNISSDKNFVDLFAGAGGLSLGLHLSGLNGIFAVERDKMAFSTLKHNLIDRVEAFNWPDWLPKIPLDIRYLLDRYSDELKQLRKDVDIVVGGPPCQGFSLAGRRVEHDERNQMFKEYAKFVDLVKPEALLFENVPGFSMPFRQNKASEKSFSSILAEQLKQIGYEAPAIGTIDFSKFGIPQKRRRLIISTTIKGGDPIKIFEKLKNRERMDTVTTEDDLEQFHKDHHEKHGTYGCIYTFFRGSMSEE